MKGLATAESDVDLGYSDEDLPKLYEKIMELNNNFIQIDK